MTTEYITLKIENQENYSQLHELLDAGVEEIVWVDRSPKNYFYLRVAVDEFFDEDVEDISFTDDIIILEETQFIL